MSHPPHTNTEDQPTHQRDVIGILSAWKVYSDESCKLTPHNKEKSCLKLHFVSI